MAEIKEKHPSWFKMKLERRELIRQLAPETAVNVLLACWDFLETGARPDTLSPIESVAFASFMPDMEEAWARYIQRITAKTNRGESTDIDRDHMTSTETEEETDSILLRNIDRERVGKPPKRPRFVPPEVEEVRAYCLERKNGIDPASFVDYYAARGWKLNGGQTMKDWKAAVRTWERRHKTEQRGGDEDDYWSQ